MNGLEDAIITLLLETHYCDFDGDKSSITPESCREATEDYSRPFSWSDKKTIEGLLSYIEGLPSELVSAACLCAWNQVKWEVVAKSVRDQV